METTRRDFLRGWCVSGCAVLVPHPISEAKGSQTGGDGSRVPSQKTGRISSTSPIETPLAAKIKAISNVFETGAPQTLYGYVENLGDGRGYTVTSYGFCTSTTEVSLVIEQYSASVPTTPLKQFLPYMPPLLDDDDMERLQGFPSAWRKESHSSAPLAAACDAQADSLFLIPALKAAEAAKVQSPIGKSIFYDTWLQHGDGNDPDSFQAIYLSTLNRTGGRDQCSEKVFLRTFLNIRKLVLREPANSATNSLWRQSTPRVDALVNLLEHNPNLVAPIQVINAEVRATMF